jgi:hypothetical protein
MLFQFLLLISLAIALPPPIGLDGAAGKALKRKLVPEAVSKLSNKIAKAETKSAIPRSIIVSKEISNLFGKSYKRFTIPTQEQVDKARRIILGRMEDQIKQWEEKQSVANQLRSVWNENLNDPVAFQNYNAAFELSELARKRYMKEKEIQEGIDRIAARVNLK